MKISMVLMIRNLNWNKKYATMCGHGVPREMFPPDISEDEIMKAVESCVQNQKDELMKILDVE